MKSHDIALQVMQEAVRVLASWTEASLPELKFLEGNQDPAVAAAKNHLNWPKSSEVPQALRLLFDFVYFPENGKQEQELKNYCPVGAIADSDPYIPYPIKQKTDLDLNAYKELVKSELPKLKEDWQNLSLLTLFVEKYGSCLSFGEPNIALIDMARSMAAVATALADHPEADQVALIAGDLSGIQKFIYTISSDGALKSLRARSFYLELVAEEIVQQLLEALKLPRTSVIYAGGGNVYMLAPKTDETEQKVKQIQTDFNEWLYQEFQGKIFLALACHSFSVSQVATKEFAENWNEVIKEVNKQKSRKFINRISTLLECKTSYEQRCRVCHRDDTTDLKEAENDNGELILQCPTCYQMFQLGERLFGAKTIVRSHSKDIKSDYYLPIQFSKVDSNFQDIYYHLFKEDQPKYQKKEKDRIFLVNDWVIDNYRKFNNTGSILLGNYGQRIKITDESSRNKFRFIRAGEMASCAEGIKRVAYLRMDVDNLGKIFARGLQEKTIQNLPRIAGLSRQMTYFFKVYLNSLAKERCANFPKAAKNLDEGDRPNLLFIYAGGDDLFISGTWNEVVEFAFDVYQAFRAYTGYNPDITLSGGISIDDIKFPLYQSAELSGKAEDLAKGNGRDSLGLFGTVFKWDEWLGNYKSEVFEEQIRNYLSSESLPTLFGILPFVKQLYTIKNANYSRSFVRNLLATAQLQNQKIKEIEQKRKQPEYQDQERDIRYYLHLPKIAYTLARLPKDVLKDEDFRKSLKSPYNAPYFQAIATWIELLIRQENYDSNNDSN